MVEIRPFKGLRYDTEKAGPAASLLAPPYDVIDDEQRAALAARAEHNCVRVILPAGEGDAVEALCHRGDHLISLLDVDRVLELGHA